MRTAKSRRSAAITLLLIFFADISFPTLSLALTGGPSQPELQSFEPAGTNQMVDLFSGDFTYNIPLMNVPGPNGGYPINLHYHAAPNVEEEASWVGLGWNINVGSINRMVRGIPDDFSGESIHRVKSQKAHIAANFNWKEDGVFPSIIDEDTEVLGFENVWTNTSGMLSYDTYQGFSFKANMGLSKAISNKLMPNAYKSMIDLASGFKNNIPLKARKDDFLEKISDKMPHVIPNLNAKIEGGKIHGSISLSPTPLASVIRNINLRSIKQFVSTASARPSLPNPSLDKNVVGFELSLWNDGNTNWNESDLTVHGAVTKRKITSGDQQIPAFGALYHELSVYEDLNVLDYGLETVAPVSKRSPIIPMPVQLQDVFAMTGQGNSGNFRLETDHFRIYEPTIESAEHTGINVGVEWGDPVTSFIDGVPQTSPGNLKMGGDVLDHSGQDYKGQWRDGDDHLKPFQPGETTFDNERMPRFVSGADRWAESEARNSKYSYDDPVAFRVNINANGEKLGNDILGSKKAEVYNNIVGGQVEELAHPIPVRDKSSTAIHHITFEEYDQRTDLFPEFVYGQTPTSGQVALDSSLEGSKQIAQIQVTNANGMIYHYGLPAMNGNSTSVNMRYSTALGSTGDDTNPMTIAWDSELTDGNASGYDKDYTLEETPLHAHSYLLTAVYSQDYVDVNGNGPDEVDMGYYTLFNYAQVEDYPWRAPYAGVSYSKGELSWEDDDMVSVGYGIKDMFFLESIETKTHIAVFHKDTDLDDDGNDDPREDALSACLPSDGQIDQEYLDNLRDGCLAGTEKAGASRLDRIELYKKTNDGNGDEIIQTVHFNYDYSLCQGVMNHLSPEGENGKLTLKKVWFTHGNNQAGSLSPYQFDYEGGVDSDIANPTYQEGASDRWGVYTDTELPENRYLKSNPYVQQTTDGWDNRDQNCAAWSLRKITLPSGGEIELKYESDDYQYVQDHKAMEMVAFNHTAKIENNEVVGISDPPGANGAKAKIKAGWNGVTFALEPGTTPSDYLDGVDFVYFKNWTKLKGDPDSGDPVYDYVKGWAEVAGYGDYCPGSEVCMGFIEFKPVKYGAASLPAHPMRKAGWEYLRARTDMFAGNPDGEATVSEFLLDAFGGVVSNLTQIFGFYAKANLAGWCNHVLLDAPGSETPPSFVRLNSPRGFKKGGGYRIKEITMRENAWSDGTTGETSSVYGQRYEYTLADGTSSGVAENEPAAGGDENAMKQIDGFFNSSNALVSLDPADDFIVEPIGENYLPGAGVGYSRVTVYPLGGNQDSATLLPGGDDHDTNAAITSNGKTINEFYTAKNFPVKTKRTTISKDQGTLANRYIPIFIPTVGKQLFQAQGYSQGFAVYLNDMHGKPKSVSTMPYFSDASFASTRTEYHYFTDSDNTASIGSEVSVLTPYGVQPRNVGKTVEFFGYMEESDTWDSSFGVSVGLEYKKPAVFIPALQIPFDYTRSNIRTVATTKVVRQKGILERVDNYVDGAHSSVSNLVFDELGNAILTQSENSWGNPIYSRSYPAYTEYEGMSLASSNIGFVIPNSSPLSDGGLSQSDMPNEEEIYSVFYPGDQVFVYSESDSFVGQTGWIHRADGSGSFDFIVKDINNTVITNTQAHSLRVVRSGRRNLIGANAGQLVSLSNPLGDQATNVFELVEEVLEGAGNWTTAQNLSYDLDCECSVDRSYSLSVTHPATGVWRLIISGGQDEEFVATFGSDFTSSSLSNGEIALILNEDAQLFELHIGDESFYTSDYSFKTHLGGYCQPCRILHASATTYSDDWDLNYVEAGLDNPGLLASGNPFAYGREGVWRTHETYVYQVDRLQTAVGTRNWLDGEYETFDEFNWNSTDPPADNPNWTKTAEITVYSPYGYALESKDALGIYSSEMYGYDQSLVTASAANAQLHEIAFEGFEDHAGLYSSGGHLDLTGSMLISNLDAHTGRNALDVTSTVSFQTSETIPDNHAFFFPEVESAAYVGDYLISCWVKGDGKVSASGASLDLPVSVSATSIDASPIEGWKKIELPISFNGNAADFSLSLTQLNGQFLVDDLRIAPKDCAFQSFVYDAKTYRLEAILDDNNFATFFDYDPDGRLIQRRIETERGVQTVMMSSGSTKKLTP